MQQQVKVFLIKLLLVSAPFLLLTAIYIITDPFKVLYKYDNYYFPREMQYVILNRDRITTETLIRNYPVYHYDAYIFGNSRSYFYRTAVWGKLINDTNCYHYNANDESLFGVVNKLKFLDRNNYLFRHALLVIDAALLRQNMPNKGHIFIKHPVYTDQPWLEYQAEFLKAFFQPHFTVAYLDLRITGKFKKYMKKVMSEKIYDYRLVNNELYLNDEEEKIKKDSAGYFEGKKKIFYKRGTTLLKYDPVIHEEQKALLTEAAEILKRRNVDYRIILSPAYDQKKLNEADLAILKQLFGSENVFDFTGKNEFTDAINHYYESSHYRPELAEKLMHIVYSK